MLTARADAAERELHEARARMSTEAASTLEAMARELFLIEADGISLWAALAEARSQLEQLAVESAVARAEQMVALGEAHQWREVARSLEEGNERLERQAEESDARSEAHLVTLTSAQLELEECRTAAAQAAAQAAELLSASAAAADEKVRIALSESQQRSRVEAEAREAAIRATSHEQRPRAPCVRLTPGASPHVSPRCDCPRRAPEC